MMKFDKYLKKPVDKANQLFKERNSKYMVVDAFVPVPERPTSPSIIDLDSKKGSVGQLSRDEQEAIRKYERKAPLLPLPVEAPKLSDPLPSTSKCANTTASSCAIPVSGRKRRKIETLCSSSVPGNLSKQVYNNYQPIKDVNCLPSSPAGIPIKKPEGSATSHISASVLSSHPFANSRMPPAQSYFPQSAAEKPSFPAFTFSPPVLTLAPTTHASVVSTAVVPENAIKREASPDIEVIVDVSYKQSSVVLPALKQTEPKTTDEEKEKLQILFDICAQELKINTDLKEKRMQIDDLQRKINIARADERQLNKDLASLVQQKTEIVNKCNQHRKSNAIEVQHR